MKSYLPVSNAIVTGMNPAADSTVATSTALYSALMTAFGPEPSRAKNEPTTDATARDAAEREREQIELGVTGHCGEPSSITATDVTA